QPDLHTALGEVALSEHKAAIAAAEFRRGDMDPSDSLHATACGAVCLAFNLGRAFDAGEMPDSAIAMYERYLATPYALKPLEIDHFALERLQRIWRRKVPLVHRSEEHTSELQSRR